MKDGNEHRFKPDTGFYFDNFEHKFLPDGRSKPKENRTFCIENRIFNSWVDNDNCKFFNINNGKDWFWGYAYNLMFQAIDFDHDTDIWLCKVLSYLE